MTNKDLARSIKSGKRAFATVASLREATALRVAGHRLGVVLKVTKGKKGFRLTKSSSRVTHRKPVAKKKR